MKLQLEILVPPEVEQLIQTLILATSIYCEGAKSFPPAECLPAESASAAPAVPTVAEAAPPVVTQESPQAERPAKPSKKAKAKAVVIPDVVTLRQKVSEIDGGFERAKQLLTTRGVQRMSDLNEEQMVDFLTELGVAL